MIRATLHPRVNPSHELSLVACQRATTEVLSHATRRARDSRQRLARRLRTARARAFQQGYQRGLAAAQTELQQVAEQVRSQYASVCAAAYKDVRAVAVEVCEELLQGQAPEILLPWLDRAVAILGSRRKATIQVQQRYAACAKAHMQATHGGISVIIAPPSQSAGFVVSTESGEITFAWRTALEDLLRMRTAE